LLLFAVCARLVDRWSTTNLPTKFSGLTIFIDGAFGKWPCENLADKKIAWCNRSSQRLLVAKARPSRDVAECCPFSRLEIGSPRFSGAFFKSCARGSLKIE
jgi:hypothetical protein